MGGEPCENDVVDRSDTRAGKNGDHQFRHHPHINGYSVTRLDACNFQDVGELADLSVEFSVGENPLLTLFTFPDNGGLVFSPAADMTVNGIVADVCRCAGEPLGIRGIPFEYRIPFLFPMKLIR